MYVSIMAAAVPTARKAEYIEHASASAPIFKEHGALDLLECWGDDVPDGELTSFPMAVKCGPDETVVVSFIRWPDRDASERGMAAVMQDPRMQDMEMPFDGARLIFGNFDVVMER